MVSAEVAASCGGPPGSRGSFTDDFGRAHLKMTGLRDSHLFDVFLWLLRLRRRFRVTGASMFPLLQPGDELLVNPWAYRRRAARPGDLVIVRHPRQPELRMVKRVTAVLPDGSCIVHGDNPAQSSDSREFGAVPTELILGQVVSRFG